MRRFREIWDWGIRLFEAVGLGKWLLSLAGGGGALTGYLAHAAELPWHLVLFYGAGAAFFLAGTFALAQNQVRRADISEAIRFTDLHPNKFEVDAANSTVSISVIGRVENTSDRPIFAQLESGFLVIENRSSQEAQVGSTTVKIRPGDKSTVALATVPDIPAREAVYTGRLHLKIRFGKREDHLDRFLRTEGEFEFHARENSEGTINTHVNTRATLKEYGRI